MQASRAICSPLVSVIIPCYNHGAYLEKAIKSVLHQNYCNKEIIVVDDGSTDSTAIVAKKFENVVYIFQDNKGLSFARNTGISNSKGNYLVFLDADDWLLPDALSTNIFHLLKDESLGFVAGSYINHYGLTKKEEKVVNIRGESYYHDFLRRNYVRMHATVMFPRWIFDYFQYDTSLKSCEDWDLYLKISRKFKVFNHSTPIAVYRRRHSSMSGNHLLMLQNSLKVLNRQNDLIQTKDEKTSLRFGVRRIKAMYSKRIYNTLMQDFFKKKVDKSNISILWQYNKRLYVIALRNICMMVLYSLNRQIKLTSQRLLHRFGLLKKFTPGIGKIKFGDFCRTRPFSTSYGFNRGGPIDRYYIGSFLAANEKWIHGRVLEIGDNQYTVKYGGDKVSKSDILHVDDTNENATLTGDLSNAPHLPKETFDCIILTQTLQFIYDVRSVIFTCYRMLKPGGTLLLTVPGISHIGKEKWNWYWCFTDKSITKLLSEVFDSNEVVVSTYGNVLVATAFLYGMGFPELDKDQLSENDGNYQVIITARAKKHELSHQESYKKD